MDQESYKKTLNLPQTPFPMKASLATREEAQVKHWQSKQIYKKILTERKDAPKYILHDGPPYANGVLHVGHAMNKVLKDVFVKYHAKRGFHALFTPGWDCHGLPIEIQVQKKMKMPYSKNELRAACHSHAQNFIELQKEEFERLLVFGDFKNRYATMDFSYEAEILEMLQTIKQKDLLYRENRPVSWCIHCATALADAEIEYETKESPSLTLSYDVEGEENLSFLVWTTTPWTLPSSVGLALGPKIQYSIFSDGQKRYILAKERSESLFAETGIVLKWEKDIAIETLLSYKAKHPFLCRDIKMILGDHVTLDVGTGVVHTAPAHGEEDFRIGYGQYHLPVLMLIDDRGKFTHKLEGELDFLFGENIWNANPKILDKLKETGHLFHSIILSHSYPHCWRCKNPLIVRATFQWFIRVFSLIPSMKEALGEVEFFPSDRKERMLSVIENRPDWCISRQRVWGVPIPSLRCSCGEEFLDESLLSLVIEKVRMGGADFWFDPHTTWDDFAPFVKELACPKCGLTGELERGQDILDVWFDSGVSWKNLLDNHHKLPLETPIDLYLEGNDQYRAWYQVSLITSLVKKGKAPYKAILTHGMVLDENGRAMSKSLGNVITPTQIIKEYGADVLRLWVVSQSYTEDTRIGKTILSQMSDMYRKLRNTFRFLLSNLYDFSKKEEELVDPKNLYEVDKWVLYKLEQCQRECFQYYDNGQFDEMVRTIFHFMNEDLSSFYLDIQKDPLYTLKPNDLKRRATQYAIKVILTTLSDILSPILCFTMEEIYEQMREMGFCNKESIFLSVTQPLDFSIYKEDYERMEMVLRVREKVLKELEHLRQTKTIGSNLEAKVSLFTDDQKLLQVKKEDWEAYLIVSECEVIERQGSLEIIVEKGKRAKCPRCYRYVSKSDHEVCERCQGVLA